MGSGPGDPEHHADPAAQRQAPQSRRPGPCPAAAPPEVDSATRVPARPSPSLSLRLASDMNDSLDTPPHLRADAQASGGPRPSERVLLAGKQQPLGTPGVTSSSHSLRPPDGQSARPAPGAAQRRKAFRTQAAGRYLAPKSSLCQARSLERTCRGKAQELTVPSAPPREREAWCNHSNMQGLHDVPPSAPRAPTPPRPARVQQDHPGHQPVGSAAERSVGTGAGLLQRDSAAQLRPRHQVSTRQVL
ncbi:unnamed protein product [Rangifer tarandus platyrhynchus]|uniref:Uncharacterized protein n=1 Tax=Rangifer tarandus platyrhynchus TaxID=3082113 RepID=A0ABN8ZN34_RANTA|nr:unnamed protein product [Rangifer tarandus platyrhynchus]